VPFVQDLEVHTRFLLALPLLVGAEVPAELALLAIVYGVGISIVWRDYVSLDAATWYANPEDAGPTLTFAGLWYAYVSLPVCQFLRCRWYFRVAIWARLLWQVSRLELQLVPTHPDRVGGLGFLSNTVYAFVPVVLAHGVLLAGLLANAKRQGLREYGTLAQQYVRGFDAPWVRRCAHSRRAAADLGCRTAKRDRSVGSGPGRADRGRRVRRYLASLIEAPGSP
jgi:hypothetical protein